MKSYNKLPPKERKRRAEYSFQQTERQEARAIERERKLLEEAKRQGTDSGFTSEKEKEMLEDMRRFFELVGKDERE